MLYKTYLDTNRGYEDLGTYNIKDTLEILDTLILEEQTKDKILVIEKNKELNQDTPIFLHLGNTEEYQEFKNKYKQLTKSKKR